ncbi:MAG TPA: division/cell wall cluster transcriptional repressor MraZ [Chloroflexia bacterium]|jgi:MraZ protein|nr:division/cell wall cluster transcriptional repressor MraZ [Chloroflexia bacterium]HYP39920.1 division/cell wall cluster transcriptional repressor MraZ [Chloroflexia bacterium]
MFLGRFEHSVDNKGRVAVPARFRDKLSGELIITRGNDRCLYLFTQEAWEPLAAKLNALPTGDADARNLRRAVFSAAEPVEMDKQGRMMIPSHLLQYSGITTNVAILGLGSYIEIWDQQAWLTLDSNIEKNVDVISSHLAGQY